MPFSNYEDIAQVQVEFNIRYIKANFIDANSIEPSNAFSRELSFTQETIDFQSSEGARREAVIFPILREIYKSYHDKCALWIQKPIFINEELCNTPDYLIATKSPLGKTVLEKPLLAVVEAKKNDFQIGWAQCLAELVVIQKINDDENNPTYGIVSDGERWEFGKLENKVFTQNDLTYLIGNLARLFGALHFVFKAAIE